MRFHSRIHGINLITGRFLECWRYVKPRLGDGEEVCLY